MTESLITDEHPVRLENAGGGSEVVLVCEHAGRMLPAFIDSLGIGVDAMSSHIAWDLGVAELSGILSNLLDAPLIMQRYSRLVYDCNRVFEAEDVIVTRSDNLAIPGNVGLDPDQRKKRYESIYRPFEEAIADLINLRQQRGLNSVLVTVHSFTPVYKGRQRELELGILHDSDTRLADALLLQLQSEPELVYARNEPYSPADGATHTLITHGVKKGLLNVMLELRNDLIGDNKSQQLWADRIHRLLLKSLKQIADAEIS